MANEQKNNSKLLSTILIGLIAFIGGAVVMYGVNFMLTKDNITEVPTPTAAFFDAENAHVQATVTDFSDSTITLTNKNNQQETYPLSPQVFISKPNGTQVSTASGQVQSLEKNRDATVNFMKIEGEYRVVSVLYSSASNSSR